MSSSPYVGEIILIAFNFAPAGYAFCDGQLMPISENETLFQLIGTTYGGDGQTTFALPDLRGRTPIGSGQGPGLSNYVIGEAFGTEGVTITISQMPAHTHAIDASGLTATERVSSGAGNQLSPVGNVLAVDATAPFTTPALTPGVDIIRAAHITELRTRVDAARARFGLVAFSYTDPTITAGTTAVKAAHIQELRTALQQAYVQAGLTPPTYTDPVLTAQATMVKAVHINEIRNAVAVLAAPPLTYSSAPPDASMGTGAVALAGGSTAIAGGSQSHENRQPFLALNYCISLFGQFPAP